MHPPTTPMTSTLAWLDFSEHDRRRSLDIIDLFREREARDELGIGTVRDAISDVLFPGISTIQTRARYFLFIPWIYLSLERRKGAAEDIERIARREEHRLIDSLADAGETDGVIGIEARKSLKRLPSHIYWQGLRAWGIRADPVPQSEYHRFFGTYAAAAARLREPVEDEGDRVQAVRRMWHAGLPEAPVDFPDGATFALRKPEAGYLRERLLACQPGRLLAFLVDRTRSPTECEFPWEHPLKGVLPERNAVELEHARCFSLAMHGSALIYNLMLSELLENEESVERYKSDLDDWAASMKKDRAQLARWDREAFWQLVLAENPRVTLPARGFINNWLDIALSSPDPASLRDSTVARNLVANRERDLKKGQSRFSNASARKLWGGESGGYRLRFRWYQAQRIVNDIVKGLGHA